MPRADAGTPDNCKRYVVHRRRRDFRPDSASRDECRGLCAGPQDNAPFRMGENRGHYADPRHRTLQDYPRRPLDLPGGSELCRAVQGGSELSSRFKYKLKDRVGSRRGEGVVLFGFSSDKNRVTQYVVKRDDGSVFAEFEEELTNVR